MAGPLLDRRAGMTSRNLNDRGFSMIELLLTAVLIAIASGTGVALLQDITDAMKLGNDARSVERALQRAKLAAVSANRPMRVRFDCPSARGYRITELVGTPSIPAGADGAADRCSETAYPYPSDSDRSPLTRPNNDGPQQWLDATVSFNTATTIEFWPDGTAHTNTGGTNPWPNIAGTGYTVILAKGSKNKSILVNGVGKIQILQ
jgi:prepilin-type N-terminal cleavage/methylation domain-containing protein